MDPRSLMDRGCHGIFAVAGSCWPRGAAKGVTEDTDGVTVRAIARVGDGDLGSKQAARPISVESRRSIDRSRQRTAAFGRWRNRRYYRPAPGLGAVVQRNNPDRAVRRRADGRRGVRARSTARPISRPFRNMCSPCCAARADRIATTRKSDRLPPAGEANVARQVIKVSTPTRGSGDREVMRVRAARPGHRQSRAVDLRALCQHSAVQCATPARRGRRRRRPVRRHGVEPDGEITFVTRDLAALLPRVRIATVLPMDDVIVRVREVANWAGPTPAARYVVAGASACRHADELRGGSDRARSLRRLRSPHRSREHHADAEDRCAGHRRQFLERARPYREEGREHQLHPARFRRRPRRYQGRGDGTRAARSRRRPQGGPEAAHPDRRRRDSALSPIGSSCRAKRPPRRPSRSPISGNTSPSTCRASIRR